MKKSRFALVLLLFITLTFNATGQELTVWGNRYYQDANRISKSQFKSLLSTQPELQKMWNSAGTYDVLSAIATITAVPLYYSSLTSEVSTQTRQVMQVSAVGAVVVSAVLSSTSNKLRREALLSYNDAQDCISFHFGVTSNGVGLVGSF